MKDLIKFTALICVCLSALHGMESEDFYRSFHVSSKHTFQIDDFYENKALKRWKNMQRNHTESIEKHNLFCVMISSEKGSGHTEHQTRTYISGRIMLPNTTNTVDFWERNIGKIPRPPTKKDSKEYKTDIYPELIKKYEKDMNTWALRQYGVFFDLDLSLHRPCTEPVAALDFFLPQCKILNKYSDVKAIHLNLVSTNPMCPNCSKSFPKFASYLRKILGDKFSCTFLSEKF